MKSAIECEWKHGDKGAGQTMDRMQSEKKIGGVRVREPGRSALNARMRRCLILRQGASPLKPPAPFPSGSRLQNGGNLSRVRKPRNTSAPLTDSLRSKTSTEMRERGPSARRAVSRGNGALRALEALPQTPPGGEPPETTFYCPIIFSLTGDGHLMEAATVRERCR